MKVSKWVDFGQDVEVDISADDIRAALAEAFNVVTEDRLGEGGPNRNDVLLAFNSMAAFLNALSDQQIGLLTSAQRLHVEKFLRKAAGRFGIAEPPDVTAPEPRK